MKCCKCEKEIDISKHDIPPKWFGIYELGKLLRVICHECLRKINNADY